MKVLNVGALEILFIALLALIILGPKNAMKALGDFGSWIKNFRDSQIWQDLMNTQKEIRDLPKRMMDEAEIKNALADINSSLQYQKSTTKKKPHQEIEVNQESNQTITPRSIDDQS